MFLLSSSMRLQAGAGSQMMASRHLRGDARFGLGVWGNVFAMLIKSEKKKVKIENVSEKTKE